MRQTLWIVLSVLMVGFTPAAVLAGSSCPSDLNNDTEVNAADLALLLGAWGPNPGHPADFNADDVVNAADLALLLGAWGLCPPAGPSCQEYCDIMALNCAGANAQYDDMAHCMDYCTSWAALPAGGEGELSGNSVGCRITHAGFAAQIAFIHCPHAGPTGGNQCGTWCENYCYLAGLNCTADNALYADEDECMAACAAFPTNGQSNAVTGNTVQCRIYYLGLAGSDPGAGTAADHCPAGAGDGGGVCIDPESRSARQFGPPANPVIACPFQRGQCLNQEAQRTRNQWCRELSELSG